MSQNTLLFLILTIELCQHAEVHKDNTTYFEVIPSSSTKIWRIEGEYTREMAEKNRTIPTDTSLKVDID